jgi:putative endonuclease
MNKQGFVYILTNRTHTVLYTGVTNNLQRRVYQHRNGQTGGFSRKYNVKKLVYYEVAESMASAITREKQIKAGSRQKKIDLVNAMNPRWDDLSEQL